MDEVLSILKDHKGIVTPEILEKIENSEEIKKKIDSIPNGWYQLHEKSSTQKVAWEIRDMAIERANSFEGYAPFISHYPTIERISTGALFHAKTSSQYRRVAGTAGFFCICERAFNNCLELLESTEEAKDMARAIDSASRIINVDQFKKNIMLSTIKKGSALAKNLVEVDQMYKCGQDYAHTYDKEFFVWVVAEQLALSTIEFDRRNILENQVNLCRKCTRWKQVKKYCLLIPLLISILEFGKYQNLKSGDENNGH